MSIVIVCVGDCLGVGACLDSQRVAAGHKYKLSQFMKCILKYSGINNKPKKQLYVIFS